MRLLKLLRSAFHWLTPRRYWYVMAASTIVHAIFVLIFKTHPGVDGVIYQEIARSINGSDSVWACGAFSHAYWPPLFCIYLALFYRLFGEAQILFFLLNIIMALGTAIISRKYLEYVFDRTVARWSTLLCYNSFIVFNFTVYYKYELLTGLLLAVSLLLAMVPARRHPVGRLIGSGVFLGWAALASARVLVVAPAIIYFLMKTRKTSPIKPIAAVAAFVLAVALGIMPWTIRNYVCHHELIVITTNGGTNFYTGFNENADGGYLHPAQLPPPYDTWERTDQAALYRAGWRFIVDHPGRAVALMLRKINLMWRIHYFDMAFFYPFLYVGIFILPWLVSADRKPWARTFQLILLLYTAFHMLFIARYYYVVPLLPLIYGIAVAGQYRCAGRLWHRLSDRR